MSKFSDSFKSMMGLGDEDDFTVTESGEEYDLPENITIESKKPERKPEPKSAPKTEPVKPDPTPKAESQTERKPEPKSAGTASEQPKKPANQPQQKPAQKPRSQEQGFKVRTDVAFDDEDEKIISRLFSEYKAEKQKKDNKDAQPAMEAALATLVAFAEKDETFAKKFYRAAKKFAPKEYGAFFAIGGQLVPVSAFKTLPEGITPEVHELKNGEPLPKPLSAEKAAGILPTLLSK